MTNPTEQERANQVATDLERLAAFVRANPDLADRIADQYFLLYLMPKHDPRAAMADIARRARRAGATIRKDGDERYAKALLDFGGITLQVYAQRDQVCERVVIGTRQVEIEEPDPELLAKVPTVRRIATVEDVEWRCTPLLAPAEHAEAVSAR